MYKYYSLNRPISIGSAPKGFIDFINYDARERIKDTNYEAFGEVYYEERLSAKEVHDYELKEEPTQEEKNKVLEDIKELDEIYTKIEKFKPNDEKLDNTMKKISKLIKQEIIKQMNNNLISHKEYVESIESITEDEETL